MLKSLTQTTNIYFNRVRCLMCFSFIFHSRDSEVRYFYTASEQMLCSALRYL